MKTLWFAAGALGLCLPGPSAQASLLLSSLTPSTGNGIGAVTTILTVQSPGNSTAEAGCVGGAGSTETINANCGTAVGASSFAFGQTQTGASQTGLRALPSGITNASQIGILFNPAQPGNMNFSITLQELNAQIYSRASNGTLTLIDDAVYTGPTNLTSLPGIGNAGWVFTLDAAEQTLVNSAITAAGNSGATIVVGASLEAGCGANAFASCTGEFGATGGHDVVQIAAITGASVPEPATYLLVACGLGIALLARRIRA